MQQINYNNFIIRATAFQDDTGRWIGQASILPMRGEMDATRIKDPMVFDNEVFDSQMEAEDFALDGAQFFIDNELQNAGSE